MATFEERITSDGTGVEIRRTGRPKEPEHTKHYVGVPKGHRITEEEARAMAAALYDAIAAEQAEVARKKE